MFDFLSSWLADFVCWVQTAAVDFANNWIVGMADLINAILGALPNFPDVTLPASVSDGFEWVAYWFPLSWFITNVGVFLLLCIAWWGLSIPLRWAKAVRGGA